MTSTALELSEILLKNETRNLIPQQSVILQPSLPYCGWVFCNFVFQVNGTRSAENLIPDESTRLLEVLDYDDIDEVSNMFHCKCLQLK